jgi:hypothetical protein
LNDGIQRRRTLVVPDDTCRIDRHYAQSIALVDGSDGSRSPVARKRQLDDAVERDDDRLLLAVEARPQANEAASVCRGRRAASSVEGYHRDGSGVARG